jgi:cytoskeletal protein CcmA (bactofilin family)
MLMSKKKKAFTNHHSLLCSATKVVGDIYFSGDFYLEGSVKGNIYAEEGKPSKLIVAETGVVEGEIHAFNVIINGHVRGAIHSSKHIELAAKAVVEGAIHYQSIEMVKGAQLKGQMHSNPGAPLADNDELVDSELEDNTLGAAVNS